jgi:hypothetical protein
VGGYGKRPSPPTYHRIAITLHHPKNAIQKIPQILAIKKIILKI